MTAAANQTPGRSIRWPYGVSVVSRSTMTQAELSRPMLSLPSLAAVRVFEAAARHQNFTRAAEELGMTQAAVSYQIAILEDQLGMAMFARAHGKVTLTAEAARVAAHVTKAFTLMGEAFAAVREADEKLLTVSCTNAVATNWLAPRLNRFQALRPDLDVQLHISDAFASFDVADVAIRAMREPDPSLHAQLLMPITVVPMASPAFLERYPLQRPTDILSVPRLSPQDSWWRIWLAEAGVVDEALARSRLRLESQVAEGAAAMAGSGLAILMPELWTESVALGRLAIPFDQGVDTGMNLWIVCQTTRRNARKIKAFRDWIVLEFAGEKQI